jgi:hypothetical protein
MYSACYRSRFGCWPGHDVIRGLGPNQGVALFPRVAFYGFSQSNGSTVSHQRFITPATR